MTGAWRLMACMLHRALLACALVVATAAAAGESAGAAALGKLTVLAYHDVVDARTPDVDQDAVTQRELAEQLQWLRASGYQFVSLQQVLEADKGNVTLPSRAVLLTFDDGYRSFYTRVMPLLRMLQVPAVAAIVGSWLEPDASGRVLVDGVPTSAERFMTPAQVKEIAASGLVEVASHTWGQHESVMASPQGSRIPAVVTRKYDNAARTYEDEATYQKRLARDFERNAQFIEKVTGRRPRALVWPYGRYNGKALQAAAETGHELTMSLDELEVPDPGLPLGRKYVTGVHSLKQFAASVKRQRPAKRAYRHLALELGDFVLASAASDDEVVSSVLDTVARSGANAALVNPFSADCKAWFAGSRKVERDMLTRTVWQLHVRNDVDVFLDLNLERCLDAETAVSEVRRMSQLAAFDGIVLRGTTGSTRLANELAQAFLSERPGRAVVSNLELKGRTAEFVRFSACDPRNPATTPAQGLPRWVEGVFGGCQATAAAGGAIRGGAASWGVRVESGAAVRSSSFLEETVRPLLLGVVAR